MTEKKALGAQELLDAAENVKAKRTVWLESFGVPISREFAEFAEAIGALTDLAEAYAASLADSTMPLLKRIYDHLTGPPKESDFTLARELRDFLADSPSPTRIHDLREGLSWALDLLDMYDEKLIALGEPRELVYDALHLLAKAKARKALAGADSPSGTAAPGIAEEDICPVCYNGISCCDCSKSLGATPSQPSKETASSVGQGHAGTQFSSSPSGTAAETKEPCEIKQVNAICWKVYFFGQFVGAENSEYKARFRVTEFLQSLRRYVDEAKGKVAATQESNSRPFLRPGSDGGVAGAESATVRGVHGRDCDSDSISQEAYNAAYRFMHQWLKANNPKAASNPKITLRIRRNRLAALLCEFAASGPSLREKEPEWISVEERLPQENERVLIWFNEGKIYGSRARFGWIFQGHWKPEGGNGNFDDRVAYWARILAPPKTEASK